MRVCEKAAKSVEDAIEEALRELQCDRADVDVAILDEGSKGFLGILGTKLARVKVTAKDAAPPSTVAKPEPEATPAPRPAAAFRSPRPSPQPSGTVSPVADEPGSEVSPPSPIKPRRPHVPNAEATRRAQEFLREMLESMSIEADIEAEDEEEALVVRMTGEDLGLLIGKHGQTLDALQYLVGLVANKGNHEGQDRTRVVVDAEGYRRRREQTLRGLAMRFADRVRREGRSAALEPMSASERRVIHTTLQGSPFVSTHSEGDEPNRKVVISPKGSAIRPSSGRSGPRPVRPPARPSNR